MRDPKDNGKFQRDNIFQTTEENLAKLLSRETRNKIHKIGFRYFIFIDLRDVNQKRLTPKKNVSEFMIRKSYAEKNPNYIERNELCKIREERARLKRYMAYRDTPP